MSTMQDLSSTVSFSPSFSFYASGDLVETAVRVIRESGSYYSVKVDGENDKEFEFETLPLGDESLFHFSTMTTTFKRSSDDDDVADDRVTSKNLFYGGWSVDPPSLTSPSESLSSSDSDDSENISPSKFYCFWSPIRSPARDDSLKSKGSSRRCRIKEFLRRSHSDGAVSTVSATKRCSFKDLLRRSHSDGGGEGSSISTSGNGSLVVKGRNKTAAYKPDVDKRRKSYLPYRQDLIGVFAGMGRFRN
ncbi:unnamed protein product [Arabidopsis thaliana]|uniref:Uncharacterized protein n=1 Tax=Arabidopsis thaliana TaxID=3702 RepID=A0A654G112_ARATH|nr:unnamed protein product [Arabidopsis thaliana]